VLMAYLLPVNGFFYLKPEAKEEFMAAIQKDARLPKSVSDLILGLMEPDIASRPAPVNMAAMLPGDCLAAEPHREPEKPRDHRSLLDGIMEHICYVASYDRPDRLFPGDPKLFVTNPLSLAYGAVGVAYAIKKVTGSVSRPIIDWVLEHSISPETYAAG